MIEKIEKAWHGLSWLTHHITATLFGIAIIIAAFLFAADSGGEKSFLYKKWPLLYCKLHGGALTKDRYTEPDSLTILKIHRNSDCKCDTVVYRRYKN